MKSEQKEKKVDIDVELSTGCSCLLAFISIAFTIACTGLGLLLCKYAWKFLVYAWNV